MVLPSYVWIILFYATIVLLIIIFRKKFEFQGKIVAMYRTKIGLKLMDKIGSKHSEFIKILALVGIGIGYVGMVVIMGFIVWGIYQIIFVPSAPAVLAPVVPGVPIPGSPITVPFWHGIIALFIVVLIHEFSHGVVARAYNIDVKSSGIVFFGPLIGAFVEPEEKKMEKHTDVAKYSIFAAGPFSNILLAGLVLVVALFITDPIVTAVYDSNGVEIGGFRNLTDIQEGGRLYGLRQGDVFTAIDGKPVEQINNISTYLEGKLAGDQVTITTTRGDVPVVLGNHPSNESLGYIGIEKLENHVQPKGENSFASAIQVPLLWIIGNPFGIDLESLGLLRWIFLLSLGLGLANLLPIGPVDGGRMLLESLKKTYGDQKGTFIWMRITIVMIFVIAVLVGVPIIRALI